jgi:hypothetical protein
MIPEILEILRRHGNIMEHYEEARENSRWKIHFENLSKHVKVGIMEQ